MADFMEIFKELERWGPESEADTLKALEALSVAPTPILDIGCGKGTTTLVLARNTAAKITAVDNESIAIDAVQRAVTALGLQQRVSAISASMADLPFKTASFDLIWAEGSAYIIGVERALKEWRRYLANPGFLVVSDLVWLRDSPSPEAVTFWKGEYPDMQTVAVRRQHMRSAGYLIVADFALSSQAWNNYIDPLRERVEKLGREMDTSAMNDIRAELEIYDRYLEKDFGYHFFVLQTADTTDRGPENGGTPVEYRAYQPGKSDEDDRALVDLFVTTFGDSE
jgi:SAM-dependent methyltransferase